MCTRIVNRERTNWYLEANSSRCCENVLVTEFQMLGRCFQCVLTWRKHTKITGTCRAIELSHLDVPHVVIWRVSPSSERLHSHMWLYRFNIISPYIRCMGARMCDINLAYRRNQYPNRDCQRGANYLFSIGSHAVII